MKEVSSFRVRKSSFYDKKSLIPFKISRSKLSNFLSCKRCFYLDRVVGLKEPSMPGWALNSAVDELLKIAKLMLEEQQYQLTAEAEVALESYIQRRKEKPLFANARSIKNALDRARMRQANRIFDSRGQILTKKELVNLEAADILQSTVFND